MAADRREFSYRGDGFPTPMDSAVRRGYEARMEGKPLTANPYHPETTTTNYHNGVTFARAWHDAWAKGWRLPESEQIADERPRNNET